MSRHSKARDTSPSKFYRNDLHRIQGKGPQSLSRVLAHVFACVYVNGDAHGLRKSRNSAGQESLTKKLNPWRWMRNSVNYGGLNRRFSERGKLRIFPRRLGNTMASRTSIILLRIRFALFHFGGFFARPLEVAAPSANGILMETLRASRNFLKIGDSRTEPQTEQGSTSYCSKFANRPKFRERVSAVRSDN